MCQFLLGTVQQKWRIYYKLPKMCQFLLGTVQRDCIMTNEDKKMQTELPQEWFPRLIMTNEDKKMIVSIPFRYGTTTVFSTVTNILFYFFHKFNLFPYKKSVDLIFKQTAVNLYNLTFPRLFVLLRNLVPRSTDFFLKFHLFLVLICILLASYHS